MITVSERAKEYLNQLINEQKEGPNAFIRVGVKGGGCSGLEYQLKFDTEIKQGDEVYEDKGIKVVVDFKSLLYLYGTELDYSGGLAGKACFSTIPMLPELVVAVKVLRCNFAVKLKNI